MSDPSMTYVRVTLEQMRGDVEKAHQLLDDRYPPSQVNRSSALWRLDMVLGAIERVLDEIEPAERLVREIPANGREAA